MNKLLTKIIFIFISIIMIELILYFFLIKEKSSLLTKNQLVLNSTPNQKPNNALSEERIYSLLTSSINIPEGVLKSYVISADFEGKIIEIK